MIVSCSPNISRNAHDAALGIWTEYDCCSYQRWTFLILTNSKTFIDNNDLSCGLKRYKEDVLRSNLKTPSCDEACWSPRQMELSLNCPKSNWSPISAAEAYLHLAEPFYHVGIFINNESVFEIKIKNRWEFLANSIFTKIKKVSRRSFQWGKGHFSEWLIQPHQP